MKILITGGAGFIGGHLTEALLKRGDEVVIADNFSTGSRDNIFPVDGRCAEVVEMDIAKEAEKLRELIKNSDAVFHLAAAVGVELVVNEPIRTIQTNIDGSANVIKAAAEFDKRLFIASTSEVYGKSMLIQVFTKLLGCNGRCRIVGKMCGCKRNVSIRVRSGNAGERSVGDIPNDDMIRILSIQFIRDPHGCRTAKIAYVFGCSNGEIINHLIAEQSLLLGRKFFPADSGLSLGALQNSCRNCNVASACAERILNALVKSDHGIVQLYFVQSANVATRHVCRGSA